MTRLQGTESAQMLMHFLYLSPGSSFFSSRNFHILGFFIYHQLVQKGKLTVNSINLTKVGLERKWTILRLATSDSQCKLWQ